jgi:hypothetical protein
MKKFLAGTALVVGASVAVLGVTSNPAGAITTSQKSSAVVSLGKLGRVEATGTTTTTTPPKGGGTSGGTRPIIFGPPPAPVPGTGAG